MWLLHSGKRIAVYFKVDIRFAHVSKRYERHIPQHSVLPHVITKAYSWHNHTRHLYNILYYKLNIKNIKTSRKCNTLSLISGFYTSFLFTRALPAILCIKYLNSVGPWKYRIVSMVMSLKSHILFKGCCFFQFPVILHWTFYRFLQMLFLPVNFFYQ